MQSLLRHDPNGLQLVAQLAKMCAPLVVRAGNMDPVITLYAFLDCLGQ